MMARVWRWLLICVPFVGQVLLLQQLRRTRREYDHDINRITEVRLGKVGIRESGFDAQFQTWVAPLMAQSAWDLLTENDAENYVEIKLHRPDDPPGRWITVTVQRWNGLTPHDKAEQAIAERDQLADRVAELEAERDTATDMLIDAMDSRDGWIKTASQAQRERDETGARVIALEEQISSLQAKLADRQAAIADIANGVDSPVYDPEAIGYSLDDLEITDRYRAAEYGWNYCQESYQRLIAGLTAALLPSRDDGVPE